MGSLGGAVGRVEEGCGEASPAFSIFSWAGESVLESVTFHVGKVLQDPYNCSLKLPWPVKAGCGTFCDKIWEGRSLPSGPRSGDLRDPGFEVGRRGQFYVRVFN